MNENIQKMLEVGIDENQAYALDCHGIKADEITWMDACANATGQSVGLYAGALLSVMPSLIIRDNLSLVAEKGEIPYNAHKRVRRRKRR